MAKQSIQVSDLGEAIREQLEFLHGDTVEEINAAGERAIKKLVSLTRKTAPKRKSGGDYAKSITHTTETNSTTGDKVFTWGAKAPHHRLTHLLVRGHATLDGGRTRADPFLEKALETVLPEYEKEVEEALKND
ncbi:MAG: hypothetical protein E7439_03375 [Ruminococcaceae bacterium]|nr:hypothetical protein [Oscillospiraceae bacterium]